MTRPIKPKPLVSTDRPCERPKPDCRADSLRMDSHKQSVTIVVRVPTGVPSHRRSSHLSVVNRRTTYLGGPTKEIPLPVGESQR